MLAQVNDRENNAPYEHVLRPARMHFPYGLRTDRKVSTDTLATVSRVVLHFYGKTRSETY
jgi:hypothetical protein